MPATLAIGEPAPRRCRSRGFTLVELMVVLAIAVLIAASMPLALNKMLPSRRVAATADRLVADVRWLQGQAIVSGAPARLVLNASGYQLETRNGAEVREIKLVSSTRLRLRPRGEERALPELVLYPDGSSVAGELEILDSGRRLRVEISMLTGRAHRAG